MWLSLGEDGHDLVSRPLSRPPGCGPSSEPRLCRRPATYSSGCTLVHLAARVDRGARRRHCPWHPHSTSFYDMATTVLRVQLTGGDRMDVTYDKPDVSDDDEL